MRFLGRPNDFSFESQGTSGQERVFRNLSRGRLIETAINSGECQLSHTGAIVVNTGKFTGCVPKNVRWRSQRNVEPCQQMEEHRRIYRSGQTFERSI